jgi:hypothetical protein
MNNNKKGAKMFDFDRKDPGDLPDFVHMLAKIVCLIIVIVIIYLAILSFKYGGHTGPSGPEWWQNLEAALGITW